MRISTPSRSASITTSVALALLACVAPVAQAQCITSSDCVWPLGCEFTSVPDEQIIFPDYVPFRIRNLEFVDIAPCSAVPPSGSFTFTSFFDVTVEVSQNGGATWQTAAGGGQQTTAFTATSPPGANPKTYNIELQQLYLVITWGVANGLEMRESPTLASVGLGQDLDLGGGQHQFGSFFDVFVEISFDGTVTWGPADQSHRITLGAMGPTPVRVSSWGALKSHYR